MRDDRVERMHAEARAIFLLNTKWIKARRLSGVEETGHPPGRQGGFTGTASWKRPGWRGMLYDEAWHVYHGKLAEFRFEIECPVEYADTLKTSFSIAAFWHNAPA